jgi:hypothetical protein
VFILHMKANENRFNPDFMVAIDRALSHVEKCVSHRRDCGTRSCEEALLCPDTLTHCTRQARGTHCAGHRGRGQVLLQWS